MLIESENQSFLDSMPCVMLRNVSAAYYEVRQIGDSWFLRIRYVLKRENIINRPYSVLRFLQRFARADKRAKLPRWINQYITEAASNLSTDMAMSLSKLFMRTISQNANENQTGISLWTLEDVEKAQAKQKALALEAEQSQEDVAMGEDEFDDGGISDSAMMEIDLEIQGGP